MDEVKARHKKEIKAFESEKRIALKKVKGTSGKGKKGKEALEVAEAEWSAKEKTMLDRHLEELDTVTPSSESTFCPIVHDEALNQNTKKSPQVQLTAKEKALAKKAKKRLKEREKERAREEAIAEENAKAGPSPRELEYNCIMELYLKPKGLTIKDIMADGNCLYRAVAHQMSLKENDAGVTSISYEYVRSICADKLNENREEYEPFADLSDNGVSTFDDYVDRVRNTNEWGGHLELRSLAAAIKKTIVVYSSDAQPLYIRDDSSDDSDNDESISLSFHKSYYALGEHYNSVIPS